jgi:hypothetical protein
MQCVYTYIPETNHVPKEYNVAAILSLLFMVPIPLVPALALMYFYTSTFGSMCLVPNMAVSCSSLTSWFPGMVLTYFLNDFELVPVAPIITGITVVFTFYIIIIMIIIIVIMFKIIGRWNAVVIFIQIRKNLNPSQKNVRISDELPATWSKECFSIVDKIVE